MKATVGPVIAVIGVLAMGAAGIARLTGDDQPQGVSQPAALATSGPLGLSGPVGCVTTFSVPGKQWGGVWHWSPAILKPSRIETACITHPAAGGTLAKVTVKAVTP